MSFSPSPTKSPPIDRQKGDIHLTEIKKIFAVSLFAAGLALGSSAAVNAQGRDRIVKPTSSQPINAPQSSKPTVVTTTSSRPILTNDVRVVRNADPAWEPKIERTASTSAANIGTMAAAGRTAYGATASIRLDNAIKSRYGKPYRYGSTGPNTYDCSGFVWSAFQEAGINFTRASARSLWAQSVPVYGDERFKFGTLVFLNGLGHMGIVADENGFYHASSSKGITYSPFKGYWESRIVGFRKLVPEANAAIDLGR